MKPNWLVLGFMLAIGLAACSKKEELPECPGSCTVIMGRLLTSGSTPLSGVPVIFQWVGRRGGILGGPGPHKKAVTTTNSDGRYRVSGLLTDEEVADGYIEVVFKPDNGRYYEIGESSVAFFQPKRDTVYAARDYLIPRKAYLKLAVSNPSQIPGHGFLSDFSSCYGGNTTYSATIRGGGPVIFWDTLPTQNPLEISGDQPILIRHYKTINGQQTTTTDSIFVPAGTTKTYTATF